MRNWSFRGRNEKEYWRYLKKLAGMKKKEEELPEEVQVGGRVERGQEEGSLERNV